MDMFYRNMATSVVYSDSKAGVQAKVDLLYTLQKPTL